MGSEGEHHPRFLQSRKWNARGGVAAHADAMHQDGPARLGTAKPKRNCKPSPRSCGCNGSAARRTMSSCSSVSAMGLATWRDLYAD